MRMRPLHFTWWLARLCPLPHSYRFRLQDEVNNIYRLLFFYWSRFSMFRKERTNVTCEHFKANKLNKEEKMSIELKIMHVLRFAFYFARNNIAFMAVPVCHLLQFSNASTYLPRKCSSNINFSFFFFSFFFCCKILTQTFLTAISFTYGSMWHVFVAKIV